MIVTLWNTILIHPTVNVLALLHSLTGNLGIALIIFTILVKIIVIPVTLPQMKMAKKQRELQPELEKIKEKFKYDKKKIAELQLELFKSHGINPASGCLTTVITLVLLIAVYNVVTIFTSGKDVSSLNQMLYFPQLRFESLSQINTKFLYLDLTKPDPIFLIPVLASVLQILTTKVMLPMSKDFKKQAQKSPEKEDDLMVEMQKQNMYLMPIMFFVIGLKLPSGAMLYILISTLLQIVQTVYFNGWGDLQPLITKIRNLAPKRI